MMGEGLNSLISKLLPAFQHFMRKAGKNLETRLGLKLQLVRTLIQEYKL